MTPKEKAIELISKFKPFADYQEDDCFNQIEKMLINAKQCALIAVDEIDNIYQKLTPKDNPYFYLFQLEYWQEVKQEIEKF
jgi:hypothetical protein